MKNSILAAALFLSAANVFAASDAANDNNSSFSGCIAGVSVGWNHDEFEGKVPDFKAKEKMNSATLGFLLGYRYQAQNKIVVGTEVNCDFDLGTRTKKIQALNGIADGKIKNERYFPSLVLVLGYAVNENWLPYVKLGGTLTKQEYKANDGQVDFKLSTRKFVPCIALGVDRKINKKFSIRLEGKYNFKNEDTYNANNLYVKFKNTRYGVRLAAIYHI